MNARLLRSFPLRAAAVVACLAASGCVSIGPGHVGVLWTAGSGTQVHAYGEGTHALAPWNTMYVYDLRVQSNNEMLNVIAVNGLAIQLDASVRYRILPYEVVAMQKEIGPEYYHKIIEPVLRSEARRVLGQYTPEEIYSTKRDAIEREIRTGVQAKITGFHVALDAILIRNVALPDAIRTAIDGKLAREQKVLEERYIGMVKKAEAEQRAIEAKGIADYNNIVAASLSPTILEYERIRQLLQLAASPNAKTVVLGPGTDRASVLLAPPSNAAEHAAEH
jgi:regulator of protease activity HflC (stomatin/prohibitin superfamily)